MDLIQLANVERLPTWHRHSLPDPERTDAARLAAEVRAVAESPIVAAILQAVDTLLLVLDERRQIVAFNGRGPAASWKAAEVIGLRSGEALACVNARGPGGCGASRACEICGALGAVLACQLTRRAVEAECNLRSGPDGDAAEFSVRASPVSVEGVTFTVLSLRDISSEKRREALEQVFFHDLLNTVAGLRGWAMRLKRSGEDHARAGDRIDVLSRRLEREVRDNRALLEAERGTLVSSLARVRVAEVLGELEASFSSHSPAGQARLDLRHVPAELELETDPALLGRVLANMVRNALEATPPGEVVTLRCEPTAAARNGGGAGREALRFSVHNPDPIAPEVQARIFQRSFSTKAPSGRGLGTYGMKLLGERYLGGEVSFTSSLEEGTTFHIRLPLDHARVEACPPGLA